MMRLLFPLTISFLSIALILAATGESYAQQGCPLSSDRPLDCAIESFQTVTRNWESQLAAMALRLFWLLAAIEFSWSAIQMALRGADISEWTAGLVGQIFVLSLFLFILTHSGDLARAVIDSFRLAASQAGGIPRITPTTFLDVGLRLGAKIWDNITALNLPLSLALVFASFFVLIVFGVICATLIIALVESFIVISAGVIFMGLGASRWTRDYAIRILQYTLSVGAKLFLLQLLAGLMITLIKPWTDDKLSDWANSWDGIGTLIVISFIFASLIRTIPEMVQGLINGVSLSQGAELYGRSVNLAANTVLGTASAGMAGHSAYRLATAQPPEHGSLIGTMAKDLANAAVTTAGDRLSGRILAHGRFGGQLATVMDAKREAMERDEAPKQPGRNNQNQDW